MGVYSKLLQLRKSVSYLQKEAEGHQYKYCSSSQVLQSVREKMNELGLVIVTAISGEPKLREITSAKGGTRYLTELPMTCSWVDVDDPSDRIVVPWYAQGVDDSEKGPGKALTYGEKYFVLKQLNIPTDKDDPDAFQRKRKAKLPPVKAEAGAQLARAAVDVVRIVDTLGKLGVNSAMLEGKFGPADKWSSEALASMRALYNTLSKAAPEARGLIIRKELVC